MKLLSLFTFIATLFLSTICRAQKPELSYTFSRGDSTTLRIEVTFTGNNTGSTLLHLPNEWANQKSLYKAISDIKAISPQTAIEPTDKPDVYQINYKSGAPVSFSYLLHKDWHGPLKYPLYFRPVIQRDFFYFEGYSGLVYPELADTTKIKCHLFYKGFAKDDFIGSSFFANASEGRFTVGLSDLLNSIFCAGKFRSKTFGDKGHEIVVALTGSPAFNDEDAFSDISKIILAERHFWNDNGPAYYFTLFLPLYDQGNTGGTAHYHAFSLFQSVELGLSGNLLPMIAHEYFHNWLGLGLQMPEPDEPYKWFSEGFTEYYAYKMLNGLGIVTEKEFLAQTNAKIKDYFLSPYFGIDSKALIGRYWENSEIKVLSYNRGFVQAFLLDSRIAEKSHRSLDELLHKLYQKSAPSMIFSTHLFDGLVKRYSDQQTIAAIKLANEGKNEALTQLLFTSKRYQTDTLNVDKVFDLGFDYVASKATGKVIGLTAGSNAAKAGLVENMQLTGKYSIWFNNTEKPALIGVKTNGEEKFIQYIPLLNVDKHIPQIAEKNLNR